MSLQTFGSYLREERESHSPKISQADVAAHLGKTQSAFSKYEVGKFADISPELLRALCDCLHLDYVDTVLRFTSSKYRPDNSAASDYDCAKWRFIDAICTRHSKIDSLNNLSSETKSKLLVSEIRAHALSLTIDRVVLDIPGLEQWESGLTGENNFWIASDHLFDSPGNNFFDALISQLRQGSRYTFFIPERLIFSNFPALVYEAKARLETDATQLMHAIPLPIGSDAVLRGNAYIIANPTSHTKRFGFACRVENNFPKLAYEMADSAPLRDFLLDVARTQKDPALIAHVTKP